MQDIGYPFYRLYPLNMNLNHRYTVKVEDWDRTLRCNQEGFWQFLVPSKKLHQLHPLITPLRIKNCLWSGFSGMEKVCEFCMALRPAVYCQADSALLCLSCDLKVHSANALSNRHPRSPLCDSCQACPASVRCDDHGMHMCRTCDRSLHRSSSTSSHKNRAIGSYTGCPSAKDLAALWDLDLGELGDASGSSLIVSSQEFVDFGNQGLDAMSCTKSVRGRMPDEGMNNQQPNKVELSSIISRHLFLSSVW